MPPIVPRWEFRIFSSCLELEASRLEPAAGASPRPSRESYLLGPSDEENWKLRGGLLDCKRLRDVDPHGLEQWEPVLKLALPAPRGHGAPFLGPDVPDPLDEEGLRGAIARAPGWCWVDVRKRRHPRRVGSVRAEWVQIQVAGGSLESLGLEGEDPRRLWEAVQGLGLQDRPNTSYVRALRAHMLEEEPR